ncbi:zinc-ribbon domain-containing protein [Mariniblastus sp.]|nr:zinc-ribbon domain-containing protein [Mariniblastus sp.]MDA7902922.1 zinc-ribbon domain-containing protein [Mariniblastus sp.]MDB4374482.1 zinc-ribbon domain-containing protein [bacterium]
MAIQFPCIHCKTILRIDDEHIGKQARCPQCQTLNLVTENMQFSDSHSEQDEPSTPPPNPFSKKFSPTPSTTTPNWQPHRGGLILAFGIASIVCNLCCLPGILAWIFGKQDMRKIDQGIMDPEGRSLTQVGMIMGMVMTIFYLLSAAAIFILNAIAFALS